MIIKVITKVSSNYLKKRYNIIIRRNIKNIKSKNYKKNIANKNIIYNISKRC